MGAGDWWVLLVGLAGIGLALVGGLVALLRPPGRRWARWTLGGVIAAGAAAALFVLMLVSQTGM